MTGNPRLGINIGSVAAYAVGVAVLLAGALLFTQYLRAAGIRLEKKEIYAPDGLMLRSLPERFPERNPRWRAVTANQVMSQEVLAELGSENYISRWFEREPQPDEQEPLRLQLHAVYYTGLIDTVPHVPERCFVGGGMVAQGTRLVDVPLDLDRFTPDIFLERELRDAGVSEDEIAERTVLTGRGIEVPNPVRLPRGVDDLRMNVTEFIDGAGQRVFAGYFFVTNGEVVPTAEQVRTRGFSITGEYAYYMKVQFLGVGLESAEELAAGAADMLNLMFPELMRRAPDWIEVEAGRYPVEDEGSARSRGGTD